MDSDLRRQVLIAAAYGFATVACVCVALSRMVRQGADATFVVSVVLSALLALVFILALVKCIRVRSRVGKVEVSFIAVKSGEYKKEPPLRGKRPLQ